MVLQAAILSTDRIYFFPLDFDTCELCQDLCYGVGRNISCECPFSPEVCLLLRSCEDNCVNGSCDGGRCNCFPGFSGAQCDMQMCGDNLCSNFSVCNFVDGDYLCQCPNGFTGEKCDQGK